MAFDNVAFAREASRLIVRIQLMIYNTRFMGYVITLMLVRMDTFYSLRLL